MRWSPPGNVLWSAALAVLLSTAFSGCTSGGGSVDATDGAAGPTDPGSTTAGPGSTGGASTGPSATPTDTQTRVKVDPNATFQGGAHQHDLWGADKEVIIFDRDIKTGPGNVCVGYSTLAACQQGDVFIRLDPSTDPNGRPKIVFPGTGRMEIKISMSQLLHPFDVGVGFPDQPNPSKFKLKVDQPQKTLLIGGINETRTDPPHFRTSGWSFQIFTTQGSLPHPASAYVGPMHWTITIFRDLGRDLPVDPPHPDYWSGFATRTLFSGKVNVDVTKTPAATTTGAGAGGTPSLEQNNTVLPDTAKLIVTLAWTNSNPDIAKPALSYCPANGNCGYANQIVVKPPVTTDGSTKRVYEVEVRPDWWDSPYATKTRWGFSWYFQDPTGGENGSLKGTLDWTIEIVKRV